jgi:hypothetical protein
MGKSPAASKLPTRHNYTRDYTRIQEGAFCPLYPLCSEFSEATRAGSLSFI